MMDLGFDVSSTAAEVSQMSSDMYSRLAIITALLVIGFVGRMVFVAFGPNVKVQNPLQGASGIIMVLIGFCLAFGALIIVGKGDKAVRLVQRNIVDPYIVNVMEQDSCNPADGSYCVVIFQDGREIAVNWFDKAVNLFEIAHPRQGAVPSSVRPKLANPANRYTPVVLEG